VELYPPIPAGLSREKHVARLSLKSRLDWALTEVTGPLVSGPPQPHRSTKAESPAVIGPMAFFMIISTGLYVPTVTADFPVMSTLRSFGPRQLKPAMKSIRRPGGHLEEGALVSGS
jgi:hypothetical protein